MSRYGIGIDTSCYTTSVAVIDIQTHCVVENYQQLLKVKKGDKGLRQSDAFYQHIQNLGAYFESCNRTYFQEASYIAVSEKPRNQESSYMPVFNAGLNFANSIANLLDIPVIKTDHQSGHLAAAFVGSKTLIPKSFLGLHLSGGTTEILKCTVDKDGCNTVFNCDIAGASLDISVGQLIDRIGVAMGLSFPCGSALESYAKEASISKKIQQSFPRIQKKTHFNISGAENKCLALLETDFTKEEVAIGLLDYIGRQLVAAIRTIPNIDDFEAIVLSGGVAANDYITTLIEESFNCRIVRGEKKLCTDNAVGVAYLPIIDDKVSDEIKNIIRN